MKYTIEVRLVNPFNRNDRIIGVRDIDTDSEESAIERFKAICKRQYPTYEVWEIGCRVDKATYRNFNL